MSKTISLVNLKGGVGKTSVTQHLAAGLAMEGKKVLVIDLDANGTLTSCMCRDKSEYSIADIFLAAINEAEPPEAEKIIRKSNVKGVDIVTSESALAGVDLRLPGVIGCDFIIREMLEPIRNDYDYILLDCPGNMNKRTINAMVAADSIIIPIVPTYKCEELLPEMYRVFRQVKKYNPGLCVEGLLLNMVDRRPVSVRNEIAELRSRYDVFMTELPNSCREGEASSNQKSIFEYDKNGKLAKAYHELVKEVLGIDQNEALAEEEKTIPSSTNRDYGPSNPWDASGMNVKDFI